MTSQPATVLTQSQVARSIKGKMNKPVKNALCTPYKVVWPAVDGPAQEAIIAMLKKYFSEQNLKSPLAENASYRKLKREEQKLKKDEYLAKSERSQEDINLRSQIVFGVTEITRNLEKGILRLVVVDRTSPWQLHRHLSQLSAVRGCPAVALDRVSDTLSPLLSVSRLCALGFKVKKDDDCGYFDELVNFIAARSPPVELPWLDCESFLLGLKEEEAEKQQVEEDQLECEQTKCQEEPSEKKDYSHLYIKRSSASEEPKAKTAFVCEDWSFEDTFVADDMWGKCKNKTCSAQPGTDVSGTAGETENQNGKTNEVTQSSKSRKRLYCEINTEEVAQGTKKKNKKKKNKKKK